MCFFTLQWECPCVPAKRGVFLSDLVMGVSILPSSKWGVLAEWASTSTTIVRASTGQSWRALPTCISTCACTIIMRFKYAVQTRAFKFALLFDGKMNVRLYSSTRWGVLIYYRNGNANSLLIEFLIIISNTDHYWHQGEEIGLQIPCTISVHPFDVQNLDVRFQHAFPTCPCSVYTYCTCSDAAFDICF